MKTSTQGPDCQDDRQPALMPTSVTCQRNIGVQGMYFGPVKHIFDRNETTADRLQLARDIRLDIWSCMTNPLNACFPHAPTPPTFESGSTALRPNQPTRYMRPHMYILSAVEAMTHNLRARKILCAIY
ncbi:hypothetical protein CIHG_02494 [Coccidioides immitis H538.4]|uniref:Uncharacterized protein n=3 Tax=Coccidioides immitis TaxID=5501 RepID=A0A0J8R3A6_COCIT|nr:hypothetical protein CIRG_02827 [Coccidioides immitis RMSCC 2394]KMU79211.1 hypothetical protein CISG_07642 [Coccidioides immitis RMSCC 3703]KMU84710.1 hypothetical protein CIHG_02494 [Coccidioides immitis H538.4]